MTRRCDICGRNSATIFLRGIFAVCSIFHAEQHDLKWVLDDTSPSHWLFMRLTN